jgi:hypothetical protein
VVLPLLALYVYGFDSNLSISRMRKNLEKIYYKFKNENMEYLGFDHFNGKKE